MSRLSNLTTYFSLDIIQMKGYTLKDFEHLKRLIILIVIAIFGFIAIRFILMPRDFGKFGHYRALSLKENMEMERNYAGSSTCSLCHEDKFSSWHKSKHRSVMCENCHGALIKHTEDPSSLKPVKPQGRNFCLLCHGKNISRPKFFPQINPSTHNAGQNCADCHKPHNPAVAGRPELK